MCYTQRIDSLKTLLENVMNQLYVKHHLFSHTDRTFNAKPLIIDLLGPIWHQRIDYDKIQNRQESGIASFWNDVSTYSLSSPWIWKKIYILQVPVLYIYRTRLLLIENKSSNIKNTNKHN